MPNAFVAKLCGRGLLPSEDMSLLDSVCATQRDVPVRRDLIREGDEPGPVFVILKGWACRYNYFPKADVRSPRPKGSSRLR
jgi:hypothetical protein